MALVLADAPGGVTASLCSEDATEPVTFMVGQWTLSWLKT